MRNSAERFMDAVVAYLKGAFTERVADINGKDEDINLTDIALWQIGYSGALSGLSHYPGCIVLVNGRTLLDPYTTAFSLVIGIGLTADDPEYLERIGHCWEDILEDSIRSDWHLGGAALDTDLNVEFGSDNVSNVYLIQARMTCQVDIGGFVYESETGTGTGNEQGEILPLSEVPGGSGAVPEGEGNGVLPALRDDHDADGEGVGEEDALIRVEEE